nr:MAG TPA: hypothetical protein [Caudoviricetes sp.]
MATSTDTHISRVILDTKDAKNRLNELENKLKEDYGNKYRYSY